MKRILWIVAILVAAGYFINSSLEERAIREARKAEAKAEETRIELSIKAAVSEMVSRTDADDEWEALLYKGEVFRLEPILTIELERLWLQPRPILFFGAIKDISTLDKSRYTLLLETNFLIGSGYMSSTELQLSLTIRKDRLDSFLMDHPNLFKEFGFNNGVAVVAYIRSIKTTYIQGEDGGREEIKIGNGELIDLIYTGDMTF